MLTTQILLTIILCAWHTVINNIILDRSTWHGSFFDTARATKKDSKLKRIFVLAVVRDRKHSMLLINEQWSPVGSRKIICFHGREKRAEKTTDIPAWKRPANVKLIAIFSGVTQVDRCPRYSLNQLTYIHSDAIFARADFKEDIFLQYSVRS